MAIRRCISLQFARGFVSKVANRSAGHGIRKTERHHHGVISDYDAVLSRSLASTLLLCCFSSICLAQGRWPEIRGPHQNYQITTEADYPVQWSVSNNENIRWRVPLPETGQSGITVWDERLFLTCFASLTPEDNGPKGTWAAATRGYCLSAITGQVLWSCELPGRRPNQVNGTFTDSTTPTPVTDGRHVWFFNAGGFMACHTFDGTRVWARSFDVRTKHSAKQFQPFLHDGRIYYAMLRDPADPLRRRQTAKDWDKNSKSGWPWMYVRCWDAETGEDAGVMPQGISVHSKGAIGRVGDQTVLLHAKGGGHSPPEKPYGISLSKLDANHSLLWERPGLYFEGTHFVDKERAYCFDQEDLVVLDLATGQTRKRIPVLNQGSIRRFDEATDRYLPPAPVSGLKARRMVTHRTNIGVDDYHFFMGGLPGTIGRISLKTGEVNYLQVPIQVRHIAGDKQLSWKEFESGDDTGSGFEIEGDRRRLSHGFGHISAATPIVINKKIYFCTVLGTVYVIDASREQFDQHSLISVNDLGSPGETWTLSPFSAANGFLYQRTSRELICIGKSN